MASVWDSKGNREHFSASQKVLLDSAGLGGHGVPWGLPWRTSEKDGPMCQAWRGNPAFQTQRTSYLYKSQELKINEAFRELKVQYRSQLSSPPCLRYWVGLSHYFLLLSLLEDASKQPEGKREINKVPVTVTQVTWCWLDHVVAAVETEKTDCGEKLPERKRLHTTYVNCLNGGQVKKEMEPRETARANYMNNCLPFQSPKASEFLISSNTAKSQMKYTLPYSSPY